MLPRLIHIGSFYLPTYGVMLAIAYLTAIAVLRRPTSQYTTNGTARFSCIRSIRPATHKPCLRR